MKRKFYVYVIQNRKGLTYVGSTENLTKRLHNHNENLSTFTKLKGPWELVWYCVFPDKEQALSFEKYLKTHSGRDFIKKRLINPAKL